MQLTFYFIRTLVFCGTRKSSLQAAETLSKSYQKMSTQGEKLPWEAPKRYFSKIKKRKLWS
jgi:hypothetical protein